MGAPSEAESRGRFTDGTPARATVAFVVALVLAILVGAGCARADPPAPPPVPPTGAQSVEFVVLNGIQEALLVFAIWDNRRIALLGDIPAFSTAEYEVPLQGEVVALSIESLLPSSRNDRGRIPTPTPATEFVPVSDGDRVEWIITGPGRSVEYRRIDPP